MLDFLTFYCSVNYYISDKLVFELLISNVEVNQGDFFYVVMFFTNMFFNVALVYVALVGALYWMLFNGV